MPEEKFARYDSADYLKTEGRTWPRLNDIGSRAGGLNGQQRDALEEIARMLKLR